ncbi:MAG: metallophosphoesterase [Bacteroidales bacterium]|nr:metallophosphoesterase [Bacteroidales bacterium]
MNKLLRFLTALTLVVAGFFLTKYAFPKSASRYPAFVVLVLIDLYFWSFLKSTIFTYNKRIKSIIAGLYWLPFASLVGAVGYAAISPFTEWNDSFRIYLFGMVFIAYAAKIIPVIILLISDMIRFTVRSVSRKKIRERKETLRTASGGINRGRFISNLALITGGLMFSSMFAGMLKWVHDFRIHRQRLRIAGLPASFDGFRIVQISDIHLGSWANEDQLSDAVELINQEEPDIIVFTGDLVNYATDEAFRFKEILAGLRAGQGIYAILGNHDYGDYKNWPSRQAKKKNMDDLFGFFHDLDWTLLRNSHIVFEQNEEKLALIGVENWSANTRFPQLGDVVKASKGLGKVPVKILLSHDPSHWEVVKAQHPDIQLTLSGHTHGFQFGIEIPGLKWSPAQYLYQKWAGLYTDEQTGQMLYVNRGLGSIGYPGRIGILPEITVIDLEA